VAGALFKQAVEGDTIAAIYWTKARMGWTDKQVIEHRLPGGALTHEERLAQLERGEMAPPMIEGTVEEQRPGLERFLEQEPDPAPMVEPERDDDGAEAA
jgi:hypothetical protein